MISVLMLIVLCYLIGSIPTSILVSRIHSGIDIREHGSGNAGFTNVIRILGWKPGSVVLFVDLFKGYVSAVFLAYYFGDMISFIDYQYVQIIGGIAAVIGHIWTVFAGFHGGKGVLTAGGVLFGIQPLATGIGLLIFGVVFRISRYVSLGSISAAVTLPLIVAIEKYYLGWNISTGIFIFIVCIGGLIIFTHRSNIIRLIQGKENKFYRKVK